MRSPRLWIQVLAVAALAVVTVGALLGGQASAATGDSTTPVLSAPVRIANGFVFDVTDFDPSASYTITTSDGRGEIDSGVVTVSGLLDGESATATVTVSSASAPIARADVTSAALPRCPEPTVSSVSPTADGFTFAITNYSASGLYSAQLSDSSPDGTTAQVDASGVVTVAGLEVGATATVAITDTFVGCVGAERDVTATASTPAAGSAQAVAGPSDRRLSALRVGDVINGPSAMLFAAQPQPAAAPIGVSNLTSAWWLLAALALMPVGPLLVGRPRRVVRPARPVARHASPRR